MNLWRRSWTCRQVARLLSLVFMTPLATLAMPLPAHAAGSTIAGSIPVAVVDFHNDSRFGGTMLGRRAADAVAVALSLTDRFDVAKRSDVENQLAALGLNPPLDAVALMKLGSALQEDSIISGRVLSASVTANPRQAKVTLAVEMRDVSSGELVNGALSSASSGIGAEGCDDDSLLDEALNKAAYVAQKTMLEYIIPQGTVLATTASQGGNEALLNVGQRSGVRCGMEMIVTRGGEQVGRLKVTRVSANDSTAVIVNAPKGVRPEDKVRAIFEVPKAVTEGTHRANPNGTKPSAVSGLAKVLGGLLVLGGLVYLVGNANSGPARNPVSHADFDNQPIVRLSWQRPKGVTDANNALVQYQIWRSDVTGTYPIGVSFEEQFTDTMATRSVTYSTVGGGTGSGSTGDIADVTVDNVPGIEAGRTYGYYITTIIRTIGTGTGTGGTGGTQTTVYKITPRVFAGQVTPVWQSQLVSPAAEGGEADFASVEFRWGSVVGADTYQVQVSSDPSFTGNSVWSSPTVLSGIAGGQTLNLQGVSLQRFIGNGFVYWRVGAHRSSDTSKGYVYSEYRRLQKLPTPPQPAGS